MEGVETVRTVLAAASGVTSLVPTTRIEPVHRAQNLGFPAIVLQRVSMVPSNHLAGDGGADANRVQVDVYAETYASALAIAAACRAALIAVGHQLQVEFDNHEAETIPALFRITQDYLVWT